MDGDAPLSSGELLNDNPSWLDRSAVKTLFEAAMREETGADLGYYPEESVAGRLRPGPIRSGDIYTLESWQESVEVGEVHDGDKTYTVASTTYGMGRLREQRGPVESRRPRGMLRDLAVAYVRQHGFTHLLGGHRQRE